MKPDGVGDSRPEAFRGLIDGDEIVLEFAAAAPAAAGDQVRLPVETARRLVLALADTLRRYSPDTLSAEAAQRAVLPVNAPPPPAGEKAALLMKLVTDLGVPFQHERSFRLSDGALHANRFLLTVDVADVAGDARGQVLRICERLAMPKEAGLAAEARFAEAACVHFGFEEGEGGVLCKLYLERAVPPDEAARAAVRRAAVPLHASFKWDAASGAHVVTHYRWFPELDSADMESRLAALYAGAPEAGSLDIATAVLRAASARTPATSLQYLEVEEENGRRSFDLNVYDAGLQLKDVHDALFAMRERFAVRPGQFQALYDQVKGRALGHVAGGVHRDGRDFFTVYYGVSGSPRSSGTQR